MDILFRGTLAEEGELKAAKRFFNVVESRSLVQPDSTIICRYSALPYYNELEYDLSARNVKMINTYQEHCFVADIENWYHQLEDYTPFTYFTLRDALADDYTGPYVLKGRTNSKKLSWLTHMFASNKESLRDVYFRLMEDSLIGSQGVIIRRFEKFKNYGQSITGYPITKEFRYFFYKGRVVDSGFYWSNHVDDIEEIPEQDIPDDFVHNIAEIVSPHINFFVADFAQREDNTWRLVELNDGQMSGLSEIPPERFYRNLKELTDVC